MSSPQTPKPAKLVLSLLTGDRALSGPVMEKMTDKFGRFDILSPWWPFGYTNYYEPEMGGKLERRMASFQAMILQADLPEIKLFTNGIESAFSADEKRRVNIDPGYLLPERFVLATGKNYSHRIYLDKGIYADLTLIYEKGRYRGLPWTYPDYTDALMTGFLGSVREKYIFDIRGFRSEA